MSNTVRYEKLLTRQGKREDLPILDQGEFGFAYDSGQIFIGTDPDNAAFIEHNIVTVYPFPNAKAVVQSYLDNSVDYTQYTVNEDLTIETEDQDKAVEVVDFINSTHAQNFQNFTVPISNLQRNVEVITEKNVHEYVNPSDHSVYYHPGTDFSRPSKKLMVKELDSSMGGIFLEYDIDQVFYLSVEYVLIQDNGWHRRSGFITVISDNNDNVNNEVGFKDDQTLYNAALHDDFIEFSAEIYNGSLRLKFDQPTSHVTKIFYRITRWNIDGISATAFDEMPNPDEKDVLTVNGDLLDINGNNLNV